MDQGLTIDAKRLGRGHVRLTARLNGESIYTDQGPIAKAEFRRRFIGKVCEGHEGIDRDELIAQLEKIAADPPPETEGRELEPQGQSSTTRSSCRRGHRRG